MVWPFREMVILILLFIATAMSAPVSTVDPVPDPYTVKENNLESTTNKINPSTAPLTKLIQLQTDAIKKILSTSINAPIPDFPNPNNKCEDIESGIKESIRKSNAQQEIIINNIQKEEMQSNTQEVNVNNLQKEELTEIITDEPIRGDFVAEEVTVKSDKNPVPNGRTLFSLYGNDLARSNENSTPQTLTSNFVPENQNIILVPCIKKVVNNGTRQVFEEISDYQQQKQNPNALSKNYQPQQTNDQLIHSIDANQKYVLERVYAPNGYLLYYMYRQQNLNPEQPTIDYTPPSTVPTPSTTTTTTSTTTSTPLPDPMYKEQLKFVIQMPYADPEQVQPYGHKFDQYAYYPPDLQPSYVNGPVQYKPTFHVIRTLIVPNEYIHQNNRDYAVNNQQNIEKKQ